MKRIKDGGSAKLDERAIRLADGTRLTEARAHELAELAEKRGPGRPSLDGANEASPDVKARIPAALREALMREAERLDVSVSEILRTALIEFLDSPVKR